MSTTDQTKHLLQILEALPGAVFALNDGIVNLTRKVKIIAEVLRRKMLIGHGKWEIPIVRRRVLLRSLHPMFEIGPVKGYDIPRQPNGDVAVGNAQKWGRRRRESVVPVWLI
jgi:hypothetical protein